MIEDEEMNTVELKEYKKPEVVPLEEEDMTEIKLDELVKQNRSKRIHKSTILLIVCFACLGVVTIVLSFRYTDLIVVQYILITSFIGTVVLITLIYVIFYYYHKRRERKIKFNITKH